MTISSRMELRAVVRSTKTFAGGSGAGAGGLFGWFCGWLPATLLPSSAISMVTESWICRSGSEIKDGGGMAKYSLGGTRCWLRG